MAQRPLFTTAKLEKIRNDPRVLKSAETLGEDVDALIWEAVSKAYPGMVEKARQADMTLEDIGKLFDDRVKKDAVKDFESQFEPPKPKGAGFFKDAIERGTQAAVRAIPGGATFEAIKKDEDAAIPFAKDVVQGALLVGSGGVRAGLKAAGVGAIVDGILEASGINKATKEGSQAFQDISDAILGTNVPSKVLGIEGLGDVINAMTRVPGATGATLIEAIPAVIAGFAGGKVGALEKGQAKKLAEEVEVPAQFEGAALAKRAEEVLRGRGVATKKALKSVEEATGRTGADVLRGEKGISDFLKGLEKAPARAEGMALRKGGVAFEEKISPSVSGKDVVKKVKEAGVPRETGTELLGEFAEEKLVSDLTEALPGAQIEFTSKGVPQITRTGSPSVQKTINRLLRQGEFSAKNPQQLFNNRVRLEKTLDAIAKENPKVAKVLRKSMNDSIENGLRFGSEEAADAWVKYKKKVSEIKTVKNVIEESIAQGKKQSLDGAKLKALFLDDKKNRTALEDVLGPERFKKFAKLFIAKRPDQGLIVKALRLANNIVRATTGLFNVRGRAFVEIVKDAFTEPNFKLPKSELNFIENLDGKGFLFLNKNIKENKLADRFLAAMQQVKSKEEEAKP